MANPYFLHNTWRNKTQNKPVKLSKPFLTQSDQNWSFLVSRNWHNYFMGFYGNTKITFKGQFRTITRWFWTNIMKRYYMAWSTEIITLPHISEYFYNFQTVPGSNISLVVLTILLMAEQHWLLHTVTLQTKWCSQKGCPWAGWAMHYLCCSSHPRACPSFQEYLSTESTSTKWYKTIKYQ